MTESPSKPLRVVLIDDEPTIISLLGNVLRRHGFEVETYGSATECLDAHQCNSPCQQHADVILTDIDMPNVDGIEFLDLLHMRNCPCRHVALMTGSTLDDARLPKIKKRGVKLFLKPFSIMEFIGWASLIQPV
jgi:CheY-like chemotaxis protein